MLSERMQQLRSIILDLDQISRYIPTQAITYEPDARKPPILRKAEAAERVFATIAVNHLPGEKLAGDNSIKFAPRPDHLTAAEWNAIRAYPAGVEEATLTAIDERIFYVWAFIEGHIIPDKQKVLQRGFNGVIAEIETRLADPALTSAQRDFLRAALIECRGVLTYAARHARYFAALAEAATDDEVRMYYAELAALCERVPAEPAASFREALQSCGFAHFATQVDDITNHSLGRLDQYLYPYYARDLERGMLTRDEAKELLQEFWLKFNLGYKIQEKLGVDYSWNGRRVDPFDAHDGLAWLALKAIDRIHFDDGQTLDLAGLDENGEDATNDLSRLMLEVQAELRTFEPKTVVKYTARTDPAFLRQAYALIATGFGMPAMTYHEAGARALRSYGTFAEEDIRNLSHVGCVEIGIPFKSYTDPMNSFMNLPKIALVTIGGGYVQGRRVGVETEPPRDWASFWAAFLRQLDYFVGLYTDAMNACTPFYARYLSRPLTSALIDGCIESATPVDVGGARYWSRGLNCTGFATCVDSLYAVKQVVYEEGRLSLDELRAVLDRDWTGQEELRQYLLNRVPKYGNGVAAVDGLARDVCVAYTDAVKRRRTPNGNPYHPGIYSFYQPIKNMGERTGATPDGRRAGDILSLNSSPSHGAIRNGLSGVLESVTALEHSRADNAGVVDVQLEGQAPPEVIGYIATALAGRDVTYAQFSVVDRARLVDAMAHPENYQDLVVRVTGFSARFVSLPRSTQEEIVRRSYWGPSE